MSPSSLIAHVQKPIAAPRRPNARRAESPEPFARSSLPTERIPRAPPPEIAFLAGCGVPIETLRYASALARRHGVLADAALIAEGLVDESVFYRALARHIGADFIDGDFTPARFANLERAARQGYARLENGDWLFAPQGAEIAQLIGAARRSQARFVVTTRSNFLRLMNATRLRVAADAAPFMVEGVYPELCARLALDRRTLAGVLAANLLLLAALFAPYGLPALVAALPLSAMFLGNVFLRLFACAASCETQPNDADEAFEIADAELPAYSVIVPLYREARVARQLSRALDLLDYPRAKLEILFMVEADDDATAQALRANAPRTPHQIIVAPPGIPKPNRARST